MLISPLSYTMDIVLDARQHPTREIPRSGAPSTFRYTCCFEDCQARFCSPLTLHGHVQNRHVTPMPILLLEIHPKCWPLRTVPHVNSVIPTGCRLAWEWVCLDRDCRGALSSYSVTFRRLVDKQRHDRENHVCSDKAVQLGIAFPCPLAPGCQFFALEDRMERLESHIKTAHKAHLSASKTNRMEETMMAYRHQKADRAHMMENKKVAAMLTEDITACCPRWTRLVCFTLSKERAEELLSEAIVTFEDFLLFDQRLKSSLNTGLLSAMQAEIVIQWQSSRILAQPQNASGDADT